MLAWPKFTGKQTAEIQDAIGKRPWVVVRPGVSRRTVTWHGIKFEDYDFVCQDCQMNLKSLAFVSFMVHDKLWKSLNLNGSICMSCFEFRLGRKVGLLDLTDCHLNQPIILTIQSKMTSRAQETKQ